MHLELWYRNRVFTPDGKLRYDSGEKPAQSFVLQWMQYLWHSLDFKAMTLKKTDGTTATLTTYNAYIRRMRVDSGEGTTTYGIVVGTDDTPPSNSDYKLGALIPHGTGAGKLYYYKTAMLDPQIIDDNVDGKIQRILENKSGADITIKETGIYGDGSATEICYFCIVRDTPTPYTVHPGEFAQVSYTLRTTV